MSIKKYLYVVGITIAVFLLFKFYQYERRTFCHIDKIEMTIWDNKLIFGHYTSLFPPQKNFLEVNLFPDNVFSAFGISISNDSVLRIFSNTPFLNYDLSDLDIWDTELIIDDAKGSLHQWRREYDLYENPTSNDVLMSLHSYIDHHSMTLDYRIKTNDSTIYTYIFSPKFIVPGYSCWLDTFYIDSCKRDNLEVKE